MRRKRTLNEKKLSFLKNEFDVGKSDIEKMTVEQWKEIRLRCFEFEGDEALDSAESDSAELSERGEIAASIVNTKYKQLFSE